MSSTAEKEDLRYPIGKFQRPGEFTPHLINSWIAEIEALPSHLSDAVRGLNEEQLDTPYRDGGWSIRQVVHHLADSHVNSYVRYKLALTEDSPRIKAYNEATWAELPDAKSSPIALSQELLRGLHSRWTMVLRSMSPEQFGRTFEHSENGPMRLDFAAALYAWHCRHHVAHIVSARQRHLI